VKIADGAQGGWLFLPADPAPVKAPVVVLCHGWSAIIPRGYQAWINHLVMRGNIVLWPNYQDNLLTPTNQFLPNAVAGVKAGIQILESGKYAIRPDLDRVAIAGHSAGGMVAAGIAASATAEGLPKMRAVMPVEPGDSQRGGRASVPLADLRTLPADTLLLILVAQEDASVGTYDGERILHESISVPASNKALLMLHSDDHGSPALVANHFTPSAMLNADGSFTREPSIDGVSRNTIGIGVVDALDYLGTWRLLDRLLDAAFSGPKNDRTLQDPDMVAMGNWSDGVAVKPLTRLK
jgi:pimeloyl-ACP methyl ester carboxylesterase